MWMLHSNDSWNMIHYFIWGGDATSCELCHMGLGHTVTDLVFFLCHIYATASCSTGDLICTVLDVSGMM